MVYPKRVLYFCDKYLSMKKYASLLVALPLLLFLFGCPVGMAYSPGVPGSEKMDDKLVGIWETAAENPEFKTAVIAKKDDYSLTVKVSGTGSAYMPKVTEFTGWTTEVDKQRIVYILDADANEYYMYGYTYENTGLMLYDVALLDGGVEAVTSTETFRKQISASLKKPDCLNDGKLFVRK